MKELEGVLIPPLPVDTLAVASEEGFVDRAQEFLDPFLGSCADGGGAAGGAGGGARAADQVFFRIPNPVNAMFTDCPRY